jgi:hypothetical protein
MAINYPGPYELRFFYSTDVTPGGSRDHVMRLNLNLQSDPTPGAAFSTINAINAASSTNALDDVAGEMEALLAPLYSAADSTFDRWELWKYETDTFNAQYISALDAVTSPSGGSDANPAGQVIFTFRTSEGGVMKVVLMEPINTPGQSLGYASLASVNTDFIDYFLDSANGWFIGRDTSYPIVFLKFHPGQNEAIFKARYRS